MKKTKTLFARFLTLLVLALMSTNLAWGEEKTLIIDGSQLTSTATTAAADYTYGDFTICMSDGAKMQSSSGDNKFTDSAILIGKSGKYIYNKTPIPGKITKFEIYANKGASAKVSVGVLFSKTAISAYATGTNTYTATLSTLDNVYDCSSKIPEGAKYFWYQVTNANNSQVQFRITYEEAYVPKLTFSATNGSITAMNDETAIKSGDAVNENTQLNITATSNDWYKFSNWSILGTGSSLGDADANPTTLTMGTADATLTANFTACNVTVNSNDENMGIAEYNAENHIISTLAEDGYRISSTPYTITPTDAATLTPGDVGTYTVSGVKDQDVTITINFEAIPSVAYTVKFDGNGHGTPASEPITEESAAAGVTLPNCTPNAGYQFVGWATASNATEVDAGIAGATYYPTEDITLYAVYNEVYTINYMVNGTNTGAQENVVKGTPLVFPEVSAPDVDHVFRGWVTEAIEGTTDTEPAYENTTDLTATQSITYYAVFAEKSGSEPAGQKTQTLQYDTWTYDGSTTDKDTYRLFHSDSYIESAEFDLSKLSKVIVYGGSFGGGSNNSLTIGDGTNTWKSVTVSGSSQTGTNTYTDGTPLSGTGKLRITSNSGTATGSGVRISKVEIFTMEGGYTYSNFCTTIVTKILTSISLSGEYPTEFWKGETFSHEGMTVTAHYDDESTKDVTSSATFSTPNMTEAGEQTVTVTYEEQTATYNITVKTIANTQETAYTTAKAKELIDAGKDLETAVYVKGTVSKVDSYNSTYHSITYWISEDGTTTDQFEVYSGKNLNNTNFASKDDVTVGDDVIIYGKIKKFSSTYELDQNNYLVSHVKASTFSIDNITVSLGGTITPEITTNVPEAERTIAYSVASEDVVKVEGGKLVTVAVGGPVEVTATLTAEGYKEATTTFEVTVIKALTSIEVKTAPTTISYKAGDKFDPTGLVITATYNDESTEDVAYAENKDKFTFEPSLEIALTTEDNSVTITYAGKETTQEISVRELYKYDITWMANGDEFTTTQVTEGSALVLPGTDPTATGYVFTGWIKSENYYSANTAPEYIVPAEIIPTEAMTFYAVFAKSEGDGVEGYKNVTSFTEGKSYIFGAVKADASETLANNTEIGAVAFTNTYNDKDSNWGTAVKLTPDETGLIPATNDKITKNCIWVLESISDGNYQFKNGNNYLYIGTSAGSTANGAQCGVNTSEGNMYLEDANATCSHAFLVHPSKNQTNVMLWNTSNGYRMYAPRSYTASMTPYIRFYEYNAGVTYSDYRTSTAPRSFEVSVSPSAATGLTTLYLDYATEIPENAEAWYVSAYDKDADRLTMTQINDYVPANTAIIVKGTAGDSYDFVETSEDVVGVTGNLLSGSVTDYAADTYTTDDGWYYLATSGNFKKYEGENIVRKAHKAYLYLSNEVRPWGASSSKELSIDWEPTGIKDVQGSKMNIQGSAYNLNGVRVNENYKGIVIMNGKKYINK